MMDITERKRDEARLRQWATVFEYTHDGVMITDLGARLLAVNRAFTEITGYLETEVLGQTTKFLRSNRHQYQFYRTMAEALSQAGVWGGEIWGRRKNGEEFPSWLTVSAVRDSKGQTTHYVAVFSDMSAVKQSQEELYYLAHHDSLTGLPNRLLCRDRLEHALERAKRSNAQVAVLFVDLDRFKNVNDSLGHPVGDELLKLVAKRMTDQLRTADTLARMGGDEFIIVIEQDTSPLRAASVAANLINLFVNPLHIGGRELYITASIGISLYPTDGEDADTLLRNADLAMYQAKSRGRNTYQLFAENLTRGGEQRLRTEHALRCAVSRDELRLYYQPQVNLTDNSLVGVEALVRWQHPQLGWICPDDFIPLAEEMGIISEIGAWVWTEACRQVVSWQREGFFVPRISINLSMQQVDRQPLFKLVSDVLRDSGLAADRLELELTESIIMSKADCSIDMMMQLCAAGVKISVDDFGTGYSSLSYLKRLPLHRLKIDYSFIRDVTHDPNDEAIARAIISLGRSLGLEVLAEGIEREEQSAWLLREGCLLGQGFLYGKPMTAEKLKHQYTSESSCQ